MSMDGGSVSVTVDGISWESPRLLDVPSERYLEFYYHMGLTRAIDRANHFALLRYNCLRQQLTRH